MPGPRNYILSHHILLGTPTLGRQYPRALCHVVVGGGIDDTTDVTRKATRLPTDIHPVPFPPHRSLCPSPSRLPMSSRVVSTHRKPTSSFNCGPPPPPAHPPCASKHSSFAIPFNLLPVNGLALKLVNKLERSRTGKGHRSMEMSFLLHLYSSCLPPLAPSASSSIHE